MNYPLDVLGFNEGDLTSLLDNAIDGLADPDGMIPAPGDQAVTRLGDLWILGTHRRLKVHGALAA